MDADTYQRLAARTLIDEPDTTFTNDELAIMLAALELGAACGRVIEYCKKGICHRHGFYPSQLTAHLIDLSNAVITLSNCDITDPPSYLLTGNEQMLVWCALGLGGEAGEVMDSIVQLSDPFSGYTRTDDLVKELGDCDWYNAALCSLIGVPMSDVMQANIDKLNRRFENGWSSEASKARVDTL